MFHFGNMNGQCDPEFFNKLGDNLRKFRLNKGLTQEMLADKAEIQRSQVTRIERGVTNPTIKTLLLIVEVLEIDLKLLFEFD